MKEKLVLIFIIVFIVSVPAAGGDINGFPMPDIEAEKQTYLAQNWTWAPDAEPNFPVDPTFTVVNPDIHGITEGDDLWSYLMMYLRSGENGYLDRAEAWLRYFKEDFAKCTGTGNRTWCYDSSAFGMCHTYGWGLVAWYEYSGDTGALAAAERIGESIESYWSTRYKHTSYPTPGDFAMASGGLRKPGRHLLLITRLAEVTGKQRWITLRDLFVELLLKSPDWDPRGMYFKGRRATDNKVGTGAYDSGDRVQAAFHIGIITEAFAHVYRITGNPQIKEKMVAMAGYVDKYGLDPEYQYTSGTFGIVDGQVWHHSNSGGPVDFWDPVYVTSLVSCLVWGYKLTGDRHYYDRAIYFFERGNKCIYGEPIERSAPDTVIHHFVDTRFKKYLDYNKGELQYTYHLFSVDPTNIEVKPANNRLLKNPVISVSPNPFHLSVKIRLKSSRLIHKIHIYDIKGTQIAELTVSNNTAVWNTVNLPGGVYLAKINAGRESLTKLLLHY